MHMVLSIEISLSSLLSGPRISYYFIAISLVSMPPPFMKMAIVYLYTYILKDIIYVLQNTKMLAIGLGGNQPKILLEKLSYILPLSGYN